MFTPSNDTLVVSGGDVLVDLVASGAVAPLESAVAALGMTGIDAAGPLVEGMIPISSLPQVAQLSSLGFGRPSYKPITDSGSVVDQGDAAMGSDLARSALGVSGAGQTVGILSDSFDSVPYAGGIDGVQEDISTGDLPAQTTILEDSPLGEDEGRAMGQIVHDVAPGASIQFATAEGGSAHFASNILRLASAGATVIVDDISYADEPFFQDGLPAQAVNSVVAQNIPYFSSAGNSADSSYASAFHSSGVAGPDGGVLHDFDPGSGVSTAQQITIPVGGSFAPDLQWNQPFRSLGGAGATSDLDIYLLGSDGTTVVASSVTNNIGGDPLEFLDFSNDGSLDLNNDGVPDTTFYVEISLASGSAPSLMQYIDIGHGATISTFATNSPTDFGHHNTAGALGVAAAAFFQTPAFGTTPPILDSFSSEGGISLLFDTSGNPLPTPVNYNSPQVTGVDGANTTFFGEDIPQDTDSLPNFFGTSAAAPHVAAVAALMLQAAGGPSHMPPDQIYSLLEDSAIDITQREDPFSPGTIIDISNGTGTDAFSGHGLVDAYSAVAIAASRVSITAAVALPEGDSGLTPFVFLVTFTGAVGAPVTLDYSTSDGTATAPSDYIPQSGTLTFTAGGPTVIPITIGVIGDIIAEPNETFYVHLSNITNAQLGNALGTGTIINDDVDVSINDITVVEGDSGTKNAIFTVTATGVTANSTSVDWQTVDGTAQSASDYLPRLGTLTFPPGGGTAYITVPIVGDTLNESTEYFSVVLSNTSAHLIKPVGVGTILDNDPIPTLYIDDVQVKSAQAGQLNAVFSVALDAISGQTVSIGYYTTDDGSAVSGVDYQPTSGQLTFAPGVRTQYVTVPVMTHGVYEPNEHFFVNLFSPVHSVLGDSQGEGTIIYAPAPPPEFIVDNGDPGYSATPGWTTLTNLSAYQLDYDYHATGSGADTASWSFAGIPKIAYQVYAQWVPFGNRATNAPFTIFDGTTPLATVLINEQAAPSGDLENGYVWQSLGTFTSTTGQLSVRLGDNANGYVVADAVRIVGGVVPQAAEMDVSNAGASIGSSLAAAPSTANGTDVGAVAVGITAVAQTFTITNTGNVDLHLSGSPRVTISGPGAADFSVVVQPAAVVGPGSQTTFQLSFHPSVLGLRQATITIADDDPDGGESPYTFNIQGTGIPSGPIQTIIDDSTPGFFAAGAWTTDTNAQGYASEDRSDTAGSGSDRAVWTFTNLAAGPYIVFATWVPSADNATNAPYLVTDGTAAHSTYSINQQQSPSGFSDSGVQWTQLTTLNITTGMLTVMLTNNANGNVVADAIELVRADVPLPGSPTPGVTHNTALPQDVNGDGRITTTDALIVINHLLTGGAPSSQPAAATPAAGSTTTPKYYLDVNGDGRITTTDALIVINHLLTGGSSSPATSAPAARSPAVTAPAVAAATTAGAGSETSTAESPTVVAASGGSAIGAAASASTSSSALSAVAVDLAIADYDYSTAAKPAAVSQTSDTSISEQTTSVSETQPTTAGALAIAPAPSNAKSNIRSGANANESENPSDPFDG